MDINERQKKAFDFAADLTKQLITLSTGIIALTITFNKDFLNNPSTAPKWMAYTAWYSFLVSILFGLGTLSTLTGNLGAKKESDPLTIFSGNVRFFAIFQYLSFLSGMLFTILFGVNTL